VGGGGREGGGVLWAIAEGPVWEWLCRADVPFWIWWWDGGFEDQWYPDWEIVYPLAKCLHVRGGGRGSINSIPPGSLPSPFSTDERRIGASRLRVLFRLKIKKIILDSNVVTSRYSGK